MKPIIQPITTDIGVQTFKGERLGKGDGKGGRGNAKPIERKVFAVSPKHTLAVVNGFVQVVRK